MVTWSVKKELAIIKEKILDHLSNLQTKNISCEVLLKWLTPRPYLHIGLDHTSASMA